MSRIYKAITNPSPLVVFMLMTVGSVVIVASIVAFASYEALGLVGLLLLFSFLLTTAFFSEDPRWQKSGFTLSFVGGYLMLLVPLFVLYSDYKILDRGCFEAFLTYYCWGAPIGVYYSKINLMILAGTIAVLASLFYALHNRAYVIAAPALVAAVGIFIFTVVSTRLPWFVLLFCLPATIGLVILMHRFKKNIMEREFSSLGQIFGIIPRPVVTSILLMVLVLGTVGGISGYSREAIGSVQSDCGAVSRGNGFAINGTVVLRNPSLVSIDGVWKITFDYTGSGAVQSDSESFHIPAHGTANITFTFTGVGQGQLFPINSTYPLIGTYERNYSAPFSGFSQRNTIISTYNGKDFGPIFC